MGLKVKDENGDWQDVQNAKIKKADGTWANAQTIGKIKSSSGAWLPVTFFLEAGTFIRYEYICQQSSGANTGIQLRREITADGIGGEIEGIWISMGINYTACPVVPSSVVMGQSTSNVGPTVIGFTNIGVAQSDIIITFSIQGKDVSDVDTAYGSTGNQVTIIQGNTSSSAYELDPFSTVPLTVKAEVTITAVLPASLGGVGSSIIVQ